MVKSAALEERDESMGLAGGGEVEKSLIGPIIGTGMMSVERKRGKNGLIVKSMVKSVAMCPRRVGAAREGERTSLAAGGRFQSYLPRVAFEWTMCY